jgi:hypothetical protein
MGLIQDFSEQVTDYAERLSNMADAAEGKHPRGGGMTRWVLLPAAGAAVYALVRSDAFSRQAKGVVDEAKTRASELPDDLVARVRQTQSSPSSSTGNGTGQRRRTATRKTSTSRKTKAGSR